MAATARQPAHYKTVQVRITDIAAPSSGYAPCPWTGKVVKMFTCIAGVINGDAVVKGEINDVDITGCSVTVTASGSAAGDVDSAVPTAANRVNEGDFLQATTNGGGSTTRVCEVVFVIDTQA